MISIDKSTKCIRVHDTANVYLKYALSIAVEFWWELPTAFLPTYCYTPCKKTHKNWWHIFGVSICCTCDPPYIIGNAYIYNIKIYTCQCTLVWYHKIYSYILQYVQISLSQMRNTGMQIMYNMDGGKSTKLLQKTAGIIDPLNVKQLPCIFLVCDIWMWTGATAIFLHSTGQLNLGNLCSTFVKFVTIH